MKRNFAIAAILLAFVSLSLASCASQNKTCEAYQSIEIEIEK